MRTVWNGSIKEEMFRIFIKFSKSVRYLEVVIGTHENEIIDK